MSDYGIKQPIFARAQRYRKDGMKARQEALEEHHEKFRAIQASIREDCEASGGHEWMDLPDNGFNAPHFITGEWPAMCKWCGCAKPRAAVETVP